jgi:two-component system, OmpR family, aerobic respiration control sensor histidine kinase ArcB
MKETARGILNAFIPKRAKISQPKTELKPEEEIQCLFTLPEPVIDVEEGIQVCGSQTGAREFLEMLVESLPEEREALEAAYLKQDWKRIQELAHKLKGGAAYCGTVRLKAASLHLERYLTEKKTEWRDKLYEQLLQEIGNVEQAAKTD